MTTMQKAQIALIKALEEVGRIHMELSLEHCRNGEPMEVAFHVRKYQAAHAEIRQIMNRYQVSHADSYE